jgi:hypothetical protein
MSVKLNDAQLVMMSAAVQRKDRCLAPSEMLKGAAVSKVSAKLVKLGLAREVPAKSGMPIWRRDKAGLALALKLTAAGLKVIAVDEGSELAVESSEAAPPRPFSEAKTIGSQDDVGQQTHAVAPRGGSKLALVIDLLRRADGASIVDLTEATGWLAHTTRAALTGLRKRGYAVVRERAVAGASVYRISHAAAHGDRIAAQTTHRTAMTASLSQRRTRRRDRHALQPRAGSGASCGDEVRRFAAARRQCSIDRGRSRGP